MMNPRVTNLMLYSTLEQASKDIIAIREYLYNSKDKIDEYILEHVSDFEKKVKDALSSYENLSKEKLRILEELYEQVVYPFDYASSDNKPINPKINQIWFKKSTCQILQFLQNPTINFIQKNPPNQKNEGAIWFKPLNEEDITEGEIYVCEKVLKNKTWINPALPRELNPAFISEEEPSQANLGDIWKKQSTGEYFVYVQTTSGQTWTSPENPSVYVPTHTSEEEPIQANLGDIWKKQSTGEYFVYVRTTDDNTWVLKQDLKIDPYIWVDQKDEDIKYILSLLGDLQSKDEVQEKHENEVLEKEQELNSKKDELENIKNQIQEELNKVPSGDVSSLEKEKAKLEEEISQIQEELNGKKEELETILEEKRLVNKKMLDEVLKTKVSVNGDNTINGNIVLSGTLSANGTIDLNGNTSFGLIPNCAVDPTADTHLVRKWYVDYGGGIKNLGAVGLIDMDLSQAQHFELIANAGTQLGVANWGGAGKSGTITIHNCQNVTAFKAPFNFRIPQSGFSGTETFAYFCIAANNIRLVRS
ncbi:hypothetical protein [Campylobacter insulaenigrae]|uniref:hypothetical protein n=1 Tax=Campylobacter insulaenigrae TaxID=260714 RepID=UPI0021526991|nr:hypothetical protein [Campylobacter insulaenigrae]MCR6586533.1 hypothetical protein [Campylobacter insulaenigrae]